MQLISHFTWTQLITSKEQTETKPETRRYQLRTRSWRAVQLAGSLLDLGPGGEAAQRPEGRGQEPGWPSGSRLVEHPHGGLDLQPEPPSQTTVQFLTHGSCERTKIHCFKP